MSCGSYWTRPTANSATFAASGIWCLAAFFEGAKPKERESRAAQLRGSVAGDKGAR